MLTLRWILGLVIGFVAGGFLILCMIASGFRRSFGASEVNPIVLALPVVALAILFAGVLCPQSRALLHAGAVVAAALIAFCIWQVAAEFSVFLLFGVTYLVAWLTFYSITVYERGGV